MTITMKAYIISDMEFDQATNHRQWYVPLNREIQEERTAFGEIDRKYKDHGYERPILVFWNVNARNNQSPVTKDEQGTFLVSGASASIFKQVMEEKITTPVELMLNVLNSERYQRVVV